MTLPPYAYLLIAACVFIVPILLGNFLARRFRMPDYGWKIALILFSVLAGVAIVSFGGAPKLGIDLSGGVILIYEVAPEEKLPEAPQADGEQTEGDEEGAAAEGERRSIDMDKLIAAVKLRVDPGGIKEVTIRPYGPDQIEIIIPNVDEAERKRIEEKVSQAGTLEFRILANNRDHKPLIEKAQALSENRMIVRDSKGGVLGRWVPVKQGEESSFNYGEIARRFKKRREQEIMEVLVVKDNMDVTGAFLDRASTGTDQKGQPCVNFMFNAAGGQLFGELTSSNLPDEVQDFSRKLGIILDGNLYSAPAIRSTIFDRGEITGSFTEKEVQDLVDVLNAGSLPTALNKEPLSRLVTGPTLGQDTITKGSRAIGGSMILVLIFMLVYYRFSGIIACMALLMNLLLIMAVMITVKAAFTLPGLAGLVLTVGMAVDANVLIFERIREERARGAALRMAIRNGFGRATTAIVDANVTTLLTAIVLYVIGTDQVKGFAVTLLLGVVFSMYTAIFCSRVIFDIAEKRRWISELKMLRIIGGTNIDFLGMRYAAGFISIVAIIIGLVCVGARGKGLLDIDFTGGVSVEMVLTESMSTNDVRKALEDLPDLAVSDVQIENEPRGLRFRINTSQSDLVSSEDPSKVEKPAIVVVEDRLHDIFGDKLATNEVALGEVKTIGSSKAATETPKEEKKTPAKPDDKTQSRTDLPDDSYVAMVGPGALLLTQTAPAEGDSAESTTATPEEKPAANADEKPAEKAAEEPAEKPAAEEAKPAEQATEKVRPAEKAPVAQPVEEEEIVAVDPFVGGTSTTMTFSQGVSQPTLMSLFADEFGGPDEVPLLELSDEKGKYFLGDSTAYKIWNVKIALPPEEATSRLQSLKKRLEDTPYFPSSSTIGGKVAGSMQRAAIAALVVSLISIVGYLWIRFQRVVFGLSAVVALVHDVLITLGMIALSAYLATVPGIQELLLIDPFKIGLSALAAFLTIIGYSLNDTIVVFDRIREVRGKSPHLTGDMINASINQTLARTLLTSITTLIVVAILYMFGGQGIHSFAFALVVGVLVGTYSSIFVAAPVLHWMTQEPTGK